MSFDQLVYVSDLVGGDEGQLASILESAVRHNRQDGITGMLLYSGGNFLQVLEGERDAVRATYQRICLDPRHHNEIVLLEQTVPERHFANWSMGFRHLSAEDLAKFPNQAPYFKFDLREQALAGKPGEALEMLKMFCNNML